MIQTEKTVLFLTSAHSAEDDRILYHQALELSQQNRVFIFSTYGGYTGTYQKIKLKYDDTKFQSLNEKINAFYSICNEVNPDLIICSEPLPIYGAYNFKKKQQKEVIIIYDVTEFYPSKKNVVGLTGIRKFVKTMLLSFFNWYACKKVDRFIFGEVSKSFFYRKYFNNTPYIFLPYYQNLKFYENQIKLPSLFTIGYTGKFSKEKGIFKFSELLKKFSNRIPKTKWKVKMIGWFDNETTEKRFKEETKDFQVEIISQQGFADYCHSLGEFSIFFDLRENDSENNLCIPIKLFTYSAAGRPVIYSHIEEIKNQFPDESFISLYQLDDINGMVNKLNEYFENSSQLEVDCLKALEFAKRHNWSIIKDVFLNFVLDK